MMRRSKKGKIGKKIFYYKHLYINNIYKKLNSALASTNILGLIVDMYK